MINMQGLSSDQAALLLREHGRNEIPHPKKPSLALKLFQQLNSVLIYLLIAAAGLSFFVGEKVESFLILAIVVLNAGVGVYQEGKAEEAVELLQKFSKTIVRVFRDGKEQELDSALLVHGDIVYIEDGSKIPADAVIVQSQALELNESSLTGESLSIPKNRGEEVFMGTIVAKGHGHIRVEKIGTHTKFGGITKNLSEVERTKTPLQLKLESLSRLIGIIGIAMSVFVFGLSYLQGNGGYLAFLLAISLAVAIVPEGLPAAMTVTLSIGVKAMARRKAIVRKLSAIEALGNVNLIATDKTGTLTTNQMRVKELYVEKDENQRLILLNSVLCSTASLVKIHDHGSYDFLGDPTEGALLLYAQEQGLDVERTRKEWKIEDEEPFDSVTKQMLVKVRKGGVEHILIKGAPETVLKEPLSPKFKKTLNDWTNKGFRVIAFADKNVNLGIVALYDPPRPEAREAIERSRKAGVEVVMVTGDNAQTAEAIGVQIGLLREGEEIVTGSQLDACSDEELLTKLDKIRIFARTGPIQKSRIVFLYQKLGKIVAVTGDGVNDVVALKRANVGIAMGLIGTDVARETADIILSDDNFATIVNAIEEGRNIVQKLSNTVKYLLTTNLTEAAALIIALTVGVPTLFHPIQLLYINLVSDGLPAIALAFSPGDKGVMSERPEREITIFSRFDTIFIFVIGIFGSIVVLGSYYAFVQFGESYARTAAFTVLALTQSYVFVDIWLSHRSFVKNITLLRSGMFIVAFLSPFVLQFIMLNVPAFAKLFGLQLVSFNLFIIMVALSACATIGIWLYKLIYKPS